jgi:hypothetical protein
MMMVVKGDAAGDADAVAVGYDDENNVDDDDFIVGISIVTATAIIHVFTYRV